MDLARGLARWTDGGSRNNQDASVHHAGFGISFLASDHVLNFECYLLGCMQTNPKADLLDIELALRRDSRYSDLSPDCQYASAGALASSSWRDLGFHGACSDM